MKRLAIISAIAFCFGLIAPAALAQSSDHNHVEFGVFWDWTRFQAQKLNLFGVGGRVGFNVHPALALEADMAYDFEASFSQSIISGGVTNTFRSNLRLIHGLVGPKLQTTRGPVRLFVVAKGGLINFGIGGPVTAGTFANQIGTIRDGDTDGVFYPGGGIEINAGVFGIRAEAGDEIYFNNNGANHNLKIQAGPQIRF
jgi:hypothetical protein